MHYKIQKSAKIMKNNLKISIKIQKRFDYIKFNKKDSFRCHQNQLYPSYP